MAGNVLTEEARAERAYRAAKLAAVAVCVLVAADYFAELESGDRKHDALQDLGKRTDAVRSALEFIADEQVDLSSSLLEEI